MISSTTWVAGLDEFSTVQVFSEETLISTECAEEELQGQLRHKTDAALQAREGCRVSRRKMSRRDVLKGFGLAGLGTVLTACGSEAVKDAVIFDKRVETVVRETVLVTATPVVVEKIISPIPMATEPVHPKEREELSARIHYKHPDHVFGDPHPFYHDRTWYLYYLGNGFTSRLVKSSNLLSWEEIPLTHTPRRAGDPDLAPYYAVFLFWDGAAKVFRTYHGWAQNIMHSQVSTNLWHWDFAPSSYDIPPQPRYSRQRDPFVFWNEDEQAYWCLMTCSVKGKSVGEAGAVAFASSKDLQTWESRGDLYFPGTIGEPEVPQMFKIGNKWYLLASILPTPIKRFGEPSYWVSDSPTGPWSAMVPGSLDGSNLNAGSIGFDGKRRLLFGWIPLTTIEAHGQLTWGGHLALPREVYQLPDGALGTRLEPEVGRRIRGEKLFPDGSKELRPETGSWRIAGEAVFEGPEDYGQATLPGTYARIDMDLTLVSGASNTLAGVMLTDTHLAWPIEIALDRAACRLVVMARWHRLDRKVYSELPIASCEGIHRMRVIIEADIVEVFLDDRYSLAARIPNELRSASVHLFAEGASMTFRDVSVYSLNDLNHSN